jgi:hypothetical protein
MYTGGSGIGFEVLAGPVPTLEIDPTSGRVGDSIDLSGSHCVVSSHPDSPSLDSAVGYFGTERTHSELDDVVLTSTTEAKILPDGTWAGSIKVPAAAEIGKTYQIWARCWDSERLFETAKSNFEVLAPAKNSGTDPSGGNGPG